MIYTTKREAFERAIEPIIDPEVEYDIDGLLDEVLVWTIERDANGSELLNTGGFELCVTGDEFWLAVQRFEI